MSGNSPWQHDKQVARAILGDRRLRRRWLARFLMLDLAVLAIGLWGIDHWLDEGFWRFVLWWGGCGLLSLWVILFALFDALMVIREEKES